ncbi:MAG: TIGR03087 family PEP-CTERM/XrtA system glycosyltransferase [Gammaproteobacteria bacterium]
MPTPLNLTAPRRSAPLRILFVTHRQPYPPKGGAKIRAFHSVRWLQEQGHEVTVAAPVRDAEEREGAQALEDFCSGVISEPVSEWVQKLRMVSRLPTPIPSSMGYFDSPALSQRVRQFVRDGHADFAMVHCSSVAHFLGDDRSIPRLLDFVDIDSQKWLDYAGFHAWPKSMGYWLEGTKLRRAEARLARTFDMNTVITPGELDLLDRFAPDAGTGWFPNGVDLDAFKPTGTEPDPDTLSFTGRMDYYPNADGMVAFCRDVLPLIQEQRPRTQLLIIGAEPTAEVRRLGELPGVTVTGTVDEVQPWVARSCISVAPLSIARGTQNKVLEAMAMGLPVVASPLAGRGVDAVPGEHLLVADSPHQWSDAILDLLNDPSRRAALARSGRERIRAHHSWDAAMGRFETLMDECIDRHRRMGNRS